MCAIKTIFGATLSDCEIVFATGVSIISVVHIPESFDINSIWSDNMYVHIDIVVIVSVGAVDVVGAISFSQSLGSSGVGLDTEDVGAFVGLFDLDVPRLVADWVVIAYAPRINDAVVPFSGADVGPRLGHEDDCAPQESEECKVSFHLSERCAS